MANTNIDNTDFECVRIDWSKNKLVVTGDTSRGGGTVELVPHKYVTTSEFWMVDLLWDKTNALFTSITPYQARIPLASIQGSKGIVLKGKHRVLTIETK